jgi:hypothetical protein
VELFGKRTFLLILGIPKAADFGVERNTSVVID